MYFFSFIDEAEFKWIGEAIHFSIQVLLSAVTIIATTKVKALAVVILLISFLVAALALISTNRRSRCCSVVTVIKMND